MVTPLFLRPCRSVSCGSQGCASAQSSSLILHSPRIAAPESSLGLRGSLAEIEIFASFATVNRPLCARNAPLSKLGQLGRDFGKPISKPSQLVSGGCFVELKAEVGQQMLRSSNRVSQGNDAAAACVWRIRRDR